MRLEVDRVPMTVLPFAFSLRGVPGTGLKTDLPPGPDEFTSCGR